MEWAILGSNQLLPHYRHQKQRGRLDCSRIQSYIQGSVHDNLTITPGYTLVFDGGYNKRVLQRPHAGHLRMAYEQISLNVTYDLTPVLQLPKWAGTVSVSGLLYFNDVFNACEDDGSMKDVLFGGMYVNWGWGE